MKRTGNTEHKLLPRMLSMSFHNIVPIGRQRLVDDRNKVGIVTVRMPIVTRSGAVPDFDHPVLRERRVKQP